MAGVNSSNNDFITRFPLGDNGNGRNSIPGAYYSNPRITRTNNDPRVNIVRRKIANLHPSPAPSRGACNQIEWLRAGNGLVYQPSIPNNDEPSVRWLPNFVFGTKGGLPIQYWRGGTGTGTFLDLFGIADFLSKRERAEIDAIVSNIYIPFTTTLIAIKKIINMGNFCNFMYPNYFHMESTRHADFSAANPRLISANSIIESVSPDAGTPSITPMWAKLIWPENNAGMTEGLPISGDRLPDVLGLQRNLGLLPFTYNTTESGNNLNLGLTLPPKKSDYGYQIIPRTTSSNHRDTVSVEIEGFGDVTLTQPNSGVQPNNYPMPQFNAPFPKIGMAKTQFTIQNIQESTYATNIFPRATYNTRART